MVATYQSYAYQQNDGCLGHDDRMLLESLALLFEVLMWVLQLLEWVTLMGWCCAFYTCSAVLSKSANWPKQDDLSCYLVSILCLAMCYRDVSRVWFMMFNSHMVRNGLRIDYCCCCKYIYLTLGWWNFDVWHIRSRFGVIHLLNSLNILTVVASISEPTFLLVQLMLLCLKFINAMLYIMQSSAFSLL